MRRTVAGSFVEIATVNAPAVTYSDTTGVAGTFYYYQVVATNAQGNGTASNTVNATAQASNAYGMTGISVQETNWSQQRFQFPRPMTDRPGLDMSFSGLKAHVVNTLRGAAPAPNLNADIARGFSDAVVDTFAIKIRRALKQTGMKTLVVAGGVSANQALRAKLNELCAGLGATAAFPRLRYATDNGAMIAFVGYLRLAAGEHDGSPFKVLPRWPMTTLGALGEGKAAG